MPRMALSHLYATMSSRSITNQRINNNGCAGSHWDPSLVTSLSKEGLPYSLCAYGLLYHGHGIAVYVRRHSPLTLVRALGITTESIMQ
jgi:hypothetical protein